MGSVAKIRVTQSLKAQAPSDSEELDNAVLTIKNTEPYVLDAPMSLDCEIKTIEVMISDRVISATRELIFSLSTDDDEALQEWLVDEGLLEAGRDLNSVDWASATSQLIGDYEGSFVGDDMVNFETDTIAIPV